jgi:hypothetical protein
MDKDKHIDVEVSPVICLKCGTPFQGFVIEDALGFSQLRNGKYLIRSLKVDCIECGWTFNWDLRDNEVRKMTAAYNSVIQLYVAE